MLIYDALKADHDKLKGLLSELIAASDARKDTRDRLLSQIRDELVPHSRAEEAVFYNYLKESEPLKSIIRHSFREHLEAEALLRTLQGMEAVGADWTKTAQKLRDTVEHHILEEETEVFSAARTLISDQEATLMVSAFERIKPEVRKGSLLQNTLDMIANRLPEKLAHSIRSFSLGSH